jgi:hypothetical protein
MTGWNVLDTLIKTFPPLVATLLLVAAGIIFIVGFSRHGMNFLKYGFKQSDMSGLLEKLATKEDISRIDAKIEAIETNHFGHLKDSLTELISILLDKNVINNQDKTRLDNKLRGM